MPSACHTSAEFLRFLERLTAPLPRRQEIHVILDNFRAHRTHAVRAWLAAHPNVHFHFTPTYSSWLNQIELWFGKIEREMLARGIFTSVADLRQKLLQYLRLYNRTCKPITCTYNDPSHRIRAIRN
jgi:transposase